MKNKPGELDKVRLRNTWQNEAGDFTPWLAGEENLRLLGDTINNEIEGEFITEDLDGSE